MNLEPPRTPAEADAADRHCDRSLGWLDDRDPDGLFEIAAVTRHAGAAHDQDIGAVLVVQPAADIDHTRQCCALVDELGDAEADRQIAREPRANAHRRDVAQVPRYRTG